MNLTKVRLSRRQALGVAAGGAAGAVALHFGLDELGSSNLAALNTASGWSSPLGDRRGMAAHLLRRAGFGYSQTDLDEAASLSYDDLVDKLVSQRADPLAAPADVTNHSSIVEAWYTHMATTQAQFPERMTLFWHGVLTSDYRKAAHFPLRVPAERAVPERRAQGPAHPAQQRRSRPADDALSQPRRQHRDGTQ